MTKGIKNRQNRNYLVLILVLLVVILAVFSFLGSSRPSTTTVTIPTTITNKTTIPVNPPYFANLTAANRSMVNNTMVGQVYPGINLGYFSYSTSYGTFPVGMCMKAGALSRFVGVYIIPLNATSIYGAPSFNKNTPLEIYSNYYSFASNNINILSVTPNCSYARYLFNKIYVLNTTIVNVTNTIGSTALLYRFTGFTSAGLNVSQGTWAITPANVSFYIVRFNYKNLMVTAGAYGFTGYINQTRLFNLANLIKSSLIRNGA